MSRDDWAREITEGSKVPEPGTEEENIVRESGPEGDVEGGKKGTGVVVFLFKDGYVSLLVSPALARLLRSPSPPTLNSPKPDLSNLPLLMN